MQSLISILCFFLVSLLLFLSITFLLLFLRRVYLRRSFRRDSSTRRSTPVSVCVVLGSGGHTAEILRLMQALPCERYSPRSFILAETDSTSLERLEQLEGSKDKKTVDVKIFRIPRSREVRQSYTSSVISTLVSMLRCAPLVFKLKCDILLCNGPGTCVPVCFFTYLYNLILFRRCQVIFIESMCRVESLSTTGKILYYLGIADEVLVQWPQLCNKYPRSVYLGRLV